VSHTGTPPGPGPSRPQHEGLDGRVLHVDGLTAGYDGVPVVRDVSLHVGAGEVVALLGPNGAGKTTTLLSISGLIAPMGGTITVVGGPASTRRPYVTARRGVAHVPEDRSLFFGLSGRENLRLGTRGSRVDIDDALEFFPALEPHLRKRAGLLSGGEQQMLALARALVGRPKLLMVDEMSLGLAPIIVEHLVPVLRDVAEKTGTGVLVVEQHVHVALEVADRAYVMNKGGIEIEGTAMELSTATDRLEASYLGRSGF